MAKRMSQRTPEQQDAWAHNGLVGACWMARKNALRIATSRTATDEAKQLADHIVLLSYALAHALKERR